MEVIAVGGSAGSLQLIKDMLSALPQSFNYSIIIILHRSKNATSDLINILSSANKKIKVCEPEDKQSVKKNVVYLAPQNYHLQIEEDKTFSLDYSETVNYARPAIDVTFECIASVYGKNAVAILLSGANADGANGLSKIIEKGGIGIVQDPITAEYPVMPQSAIDKNKKVLIRKPAYLVNYMKAIDLII